MSANIAQIYAANPTSTLNDPDLIYVGQNATTDSAISYSDLMAVIGWLPGQGGGIGSYQGFNANAAGNFSLAACVSNTVGDYSVAFGNGCDVAGTGSFGAGSGCVTTSDYCFAFGKGCNTSASAIYSFVFGNGCSTGQFATGNYSFAFGQNCSTGDNGNADYSFAFGNTCHTGGAYSFSFGNAATTLNDGSVVWGDSNATPNGDTTANQFNLTFANGYRFFGGSFNVSSAGSGLAVAEGSNAKQGVATLSTGTVVVSNTSVTANSRIFLTAQDNNSVGALRVSARTAGTSFTITSSSAVDSGVVAYEIFEPAV